MPFSWLVKVTLAPATRAPEGSVTTPDRVAVEASVCARRAGDEYRRKVEISSASENLASRMVFKTSLRDNMHAPDWQEAKHNVRVESGRIGLFKVERHTIDESIKKTLT